MAQRFAPKIGLRGTAGYAYYELSMAQGPVGIGVTGDNELLDFIGYGWLLVMTEDRNLHLYRQTATVGEWEEVTTSLPPVFSSPLPEGARRVTFAFDQSARVIVVYELASSLYLTRWDVDTNSYLQNVTVAGVDPVVAFDAPWAYDIPTSDVLMFYLDAPTRSKLMCRVQRDLYATAYELHDYGYPVVLDRVATLPLRYEVLASDAAGDPLEDVGGRIALISDLYPYRVGDGLLGDGAVAAGSYALKQVNRTGEDAITGDSLLTLASYVAKVVPIVVELLQVDGDAVVAGGAYDAKVIPYLEPTLGIDGDGTVASAFYNRKIFQPLIPPDGISGDSVVTGGAYHAV